MIHRIWSSEDSFKELLLAPTLNILLADQTEASTDRDTRNGSGKTSLIHLIHFLLGGSAGADSIFRSDELCDWGFFMDLDLGSNRVVVSRTGASHNSVSVAAQAQTDGPFGQAVTMPVSEWRSELGRTWFGLSDEIGLPTARSLLSYLVRNVGSGAFDDPFKHHRNQGPDDWRTSVAFLLDLDWRLAGEWQRARELAGEVAALRKVLSSTELGRPIGSLAELRTELAVTEDRVNRLRRERDAFRLVESFRDLEAEADSLTTQIGRLRDNAAMDRMLLADLQARSEEERPPDADQVALLYQSVEAELGDVIRRRFEEVERFHESVVANRQEHLEREIRRLRNRIEEVEHERNTLDERRRHILSLLSSGGALDELNALQENLSDHLAHLEDLQRQYELADMAEAGSSNVTEIRQELRSSLRRDYRDREDQLAHLIQRFEGFITYLYDERRGSLVIGESNLGPTYRVTLESGRSHGMKRMAIFAFDLLVSEVMAHRGMGTGFLVHDSHLFDGVDSRQIARALALGNSVATDAGFQYIVTMNSDSVPPEFPDEFRFEDFLLGVRLTDSSESGRLFGIRF